MAIIQSKPIIKPPEQPFKPQVESKDRKSVFVDNKEIPTSHLQSHVAGYNFTVDYYHQALNKDSKVTAEDIGNSSVFQQYRKIKNLEMKVTSPNTSDQNDQDKVFVTKGSAIVHNGLIPNEGDMFVADVGDGRLGVYNVTRSQRLSIMKDSVYQIEYSLSFFANVEKERYKVLEEKVIVTYNYVKEFLNFNKEPLLIDKDYNTLLELKVLYNELFDNFFRWFFSNEYKAFLLPGQANSIIDLYAQDFLRTLSKDTIFEDKLQTLQPINIQDDNYIRYPEIFHILKYRQANLVNIAYTKMGVASTQGFNKDPMMENIKYTGIDYIVYPFSDRTSDDDKYNRLSKSVIAGIIKPTVGIFDRAVNTPYTKTIEFDTSKLKMIHSIDMDQAYVFTPNFYKVLKQDIEESTELSLIEVLTIRYLRDKNYNPEVLKLLAKDYYKWNKLEQFYFIPVLLVLIKSQVLNLT